MGLLITNLTCHKWIMKIMCWKHISYMDKCADESSMNLWMNECHMKFTSSYNIMYQMCFQGMILMCEMYELWMNDYCTISIIKSWDAKFVI